MKSKRKTPLSTVQYESLIKDKENILRSKVIHKMTEEIINEPDQRYADRSESAAIKKNPPKTNTVIRNLRVIPKLSTGTFFRFWDSTAGTPEEFRNYDPLFYR